MKKIYVILSVVFLFSSTFAASAEFKWVNVRDANVTSELGVCSGQRSNQFSIFDVSKFHQDSFITKIKSHDKKSSLTVDCSQGRRYILDKKQATKAYIHFIENKSDGAIGDYEADTKECMDRFSKRDLNRFKTLISDQTNLAVIASLFEFDRENNQHGEFCAFFDFYIFRKDGTVLKWTFNHIN